MMKVLTKLHLLKALKEANDKSVKNGGPQIPSNYKSLMDLERDGVIPRGGGIVSPRNDRLYTQEEIDDIVRKVVAYKNGRI